MAATGDPGGSRGWYATPERALRTGRRLAQLLGVCAIWAVLGSVSGLALLIASPNPDAAALPVSDRTPPVVNASGKVRCGHRSMIVVRFAGADPSIEDPDVRRVCEADARSAAVPGVLILASGIAAAALAVAAARRRDALLSAATRPL